MQCLRPSFAANVLLGTFFPLLLCPNQLAESQSLLLRALALSEQIKRYFLTSPDRGGWGGAEGEERGEKKRARRGHTALSFLGALVNEDFSVCPLLSSSLFSLLLYEKHKKVKKKLQFSLLL